MKPEKSNPVHAVLVGFVVVPEGYMPPKRAPASEVDCESFKTTLREAQDYAAEWGDRWGEGYRIHAARLTVGPVVEESTPKPPAPSKPAQPELFT